MFKQKYGTTALVAGASEGMGAAYAHALASRGMNLVLIARRKEELEATAADIATRYGVKVLPVVCDLAAPDATQQIIHVIGDTAIDFLVYNAALSFIGPYLSTGPSTHLDIAAVNVQTPLALLHYFGGKMVARRRGGIVMMASLAGFQGSGFLATYGASKAFDRVLAEGLWYEWKPFGVDVIACCAGATATPNYNNTHPRKGSFLEPKAQLPAQVVEECLQKIGTVPSFVSGTGNKLVSFLLSHVLPRKKTVKIMGDSMHKIYGSKWESN
ncbi:hypothetical protein GA0116948_1273 [Chitinophaga costaii]|uniref:Short-chain dehydrogenase n=1 Tax=Chitinophaga costaii TaxID=1335309 RepID=A0A1C4G7K2_9BACT|nr:SDR family NAD(P)-dependent oxidoreductase [Chitinophaga costaii]PUZ19430.1 KR domain-containing protein [Chitinophaga costaii]SCC64126.1 hypothetical protein GA0116948_1273 [Chitinophaga costaii]